MTPPREPEQQPQGGAAAAAALGGSAALGGAPPAIPALAGTQLPPLAAASIGRILSAFDRHSRARLRDDEELLLLLLRRRYPSRSDAEIRAAADEEAAFAREFQRRQRERLRRDLEAAGAIPDAAARRERVRAILDRETGYARQHEEARANRAISREELRLLQQTSPEGAYWKLSPNVRSHTLDCLAMGEKFWPWEVLRVVYPPLHHGCPCELYGLDEAVALGLMRRDAVPDPADAVARAKRIAREVPELAERWGEGALREAALDLAEASLAGVAQRGAARAYYELRFPRGTVKGGEFRPRRGGFAAPVRRALAALRGDGDRWVSIRGEQHRVPSASAWSRRYPDGTAFSSPPGGTNVYRDGQLVDEPGGRRERAALDRSAPSPGREAEHVEATRAHRRARISRAHAARTDLGEAPVRVGEREGDLAALEDSGWRPVAAFGGQRTYRHAATGRTLRVAIVDGRVAAVVHDEGEPGVPARRAAATPLTWDEFRADALALAQELGLEHGVGSSTADFEEDPGLDDVVGSYGPDGTALVGPEARGAIRAVAGARARGEAVEGEGAHLAWYSAQVAAHEVSHGVNPPDWGLYATDPVAKALEESLTEEASQAIAGDRLRERGDLDVLRWARDNQAHRDARGAYAGWRVGLAEVLDDAGVAPELRRALIEDLKFRTPPARREDRLSELVARHQGVDLEQAREAVRSRLDPGRLADTRNVGAPSLAPDGRGLGPRPTPEAAAVGGMRVAPGATVRVAGQPELDGSVVTEVTRDRGVAYATLDTPLGLAFAPIEEGALEVLDPADTVGGLRVAEGDVVRYRRADGGWSEVAVTNVVRRGSDWEVHGVATDDSLAPGEHVVLAPGRVGALQLAEGQEHATESRLPGSSHGYVGAALASAEGPLRAEGDVGSLSPEDDLGHFGTGVRFTSGDPPAPHGPERREAGVDLSNANLYRPATEDAALDLHEALAGADYFASPDSQPDEASVDRVTDDLRAAGVSTDRAAVAHAISEVSADLARGNLSADSAATRIMRAAGWDGVDTRHLDRRVDNGLYGSVLYRPPAAARAPEAASPGRAVVDGEPGFHLYVEGRGWTFVPEGREWRTEVGGDTLWSPEGTREVWRRTPDLKPGEGDLVKAPGRRATDERLVPPSRRRDRGRGGTAPPAPPEPVAASRLEEARATAGLIDGQLSSAATGLAQARGFLTFRQRNVDHPDRPMSEGPVAVEHVHWNPDLGVGLRWRTSLNEDYAQGPATDVEVLESPYHSEGEPPAGDTPQRLAFEAIGADVGDAGRRAGDAGFSVQASAYRDAEGSWSSYVDPDRGLMLLLYVPDDSPTLTSRGAVARAVVLPADELEVRSALDVSWRLRPLERPELRPGADLNAAVEELAHLSVSRGWSYQRQHTNPPGGPNTVTTYPGTGAAHDEPSDSALPEGVTGSVDFQQQSGREATRVLRVLWREEPDGRRAVVRAGRPDPLEGEDVVSDDEWTARRAEVDRRAEAARHEAALAATARVRERIARGQRPFDPGDPVPQEHLREAGLILTYASRARRRGGTLPGQKIGVYAITHLESGAQMRVRMTTDDQVAEVISWDRGALGVARERVRGRMPARGELQGDVLARADELGERHGAAVHATSVSFDKGSTMSGTHTWRTGKIRAGSAVRKAIEDARRKRGFGAPLTESEKRLVYSAYKVLQHEALHGVNEVNDAGYSGPGIALEEAVTEEAARLEVFEWLHEHGLDEVIEWAARNPADATVEGTYPAYRGALGSLLDEAGVPAGERVDLLRAMRYDWDPNDRPRLLAELLATRSGRDPEDVRREVNSRLWTRKPANGTRPPGFRPVAPEVPVPEGVEAAPLRVAVDGGEVQSGDRVEVMAYSDDAGASVWQPAEVIGLEPPLLGGNVGESLWEVKVRYADDKVLWTDSGGIRTARGTPAPRPALVQEVVLPRVGPRRGVTPGSWPEDAVLLAGDGTRLGPGDRLRYMTAFGESEEAELVGPAPIPIARRGKWRVRVVATGNLRDADANRLRAETGAGGDAADDGRGPGGPAPEPGVLERLTREQLREIARGRGLGVGGHKATLVARLREAGVNEAEFADWGPGAASPGRDPEDEARATVRDPRRLARYVDAFEHRWGPAPRQRVRAELVEALPEHDAAGSPVRLTFLLAPPGTDLGERPEGEEPVGGDQRDIGEVVRTIHFDPDTGDPTTVDNDGLDVPEGLQRRGIATAVNRYLEDLWRRAGVRAVRVTATGDGAVAWARAGYELQWRGHGSPRAGMEALLDEALSHSLKRGPGSSPWFKARTVTAEEVERLRALRAESPAQLLGLAESRGMLDAAERALRGSGWWGVKELQSAPPPFGQYDWRALNRGAASPGRDLPDPPAIRPDAIWLTPREEYAPSPPAEDYGFEGGGFRTPSGKWRDEAGMNAWMDARDAWRERDEEWRRAADVAVSLGQLDPEEAARLGARRPDRPWRPLPPRLYHVTTNPEGVVRSGALMTRAELSLSAGDGLGLGAGPDDQVSTTADEGLARDIARAMVEAGRVTRGEVSVQDLLDAARRGDDAKRPWLVDFVGYRMGAGRRPPWSPDDPLPPVFERLIAEERGVADGSLDPGEYEEMDWRGGVTPDHAERMGWEVVPGSETGETASYGGEEVPTFARMRRTRAARLAEDRLELYKQWSAFRQHAGGPTDPLFMSVAAADAARLAPSTVATVDLEPSTNAAMGTHFDGLDEWRVPSGAALRITAIRDSEGREIRGAASPGRSYLNEPPAGAVAWRTNRERLDAIERAWPPTPPHEQTPEEFAADPRTWWHGTPYGEPGAGPIHLGNWNTAHEALAARVAGQHASGDVPEVVATVGGGAANAWRDRETGEVNTFAAGFPPPELRGTKYEPVAPEDAPWAVPAGSRPAMIPYRIEGPMRTEVGHDFLGDPKAGASVQGILRGIAKRGGAAKQGYYYVNEGEGVEVDGPGLEGLVYPVSAIVPDRSWLRSHEDYVREAASPGRDRTTSLDDLFAGDPDVEVWASERPEGIRVSMIRVEEGARGQGKAAAALERLLAYADERGLAVALTPGRPEDATGLSSAQLRAWYGRHGFVPNRGRAKDYAFSEAMIRPARGAASPGRDEQDRRAREFFDRLSAVMEEDWRQSGMDPALDGEWWAGTCNTTVQAVEDLGLLDLPHRVVMWGGFDGGGMSSGHCWLALEDGTILDPTAGQFGMEPPQQVIRPDDPRHAWYSEPDPAVTPPGERAVAASPGRDATVRDMAGAALGDARRAGAEGPIVRELRAAAGDGVWPLPRRRAASPGRDRPPVENEITRDLKAPEAGDETLGPEVYYYVAGGCGALALAFLARHPEMKLAAATVTQDGERAIDHVVAYDPENDVAYDAFGAHSPAESALWGYQADEDMNFDPGYVAERFDLRWNPEEPWAEAKISEANSEVIEVYFAREPYLPAFPTGALERLVADVSAPHKLRVQARAELAERNWEAPSPGRDRPGFEAALRTLEGQAGRTRAELRYVGPPQEPNDLPHDPGLPGGAVTRPVTAAGELLDEGGDRAGWFRRTLYVAPSGEVEAWNGGIEVDPSARGGVAAALARRFEDAAREAGATRVRLTAGRGEGGRTWARAGYDFDAERLAGFGAGGLGLGEGAREAVLPLEGDERALREAMVLALLDRALAVGAIDLETRDRLAERVRGGEFLSPSAILALGPERGQLGSSILLGSRWPGALALHLVA